MTGRASSPTNGIVRVGGIDFGTKAVHAVFLTGAVDALPAVEHVHLAIGDRGQAELERLCADASHVGIDAPDRQTAGCLLPRVRPARCAEVALAATHHGLAERIVGGPVSMLTPSTGAPFPARLAWMKAGFVLWDRLRSRCGSVQFFETYPSGSFTRLALTARPAVRLKPRGTAFGIAQRVALLEPLVMHPDFLEMWGLDGVDALAAALAAFRVATGQGVVVAEHDHHGHDGSRITLIA
ncbi:MAG TPA: DUF429 domain-containing protein [Acidimicrobiales bacterium]|nr:DUF429 domain-containing protein [Acidimicrobiales bacterium]